jgi:predicted enzyme related to lactoylglutathione lyase
MKPTAPPRGNFGVFATAPWISSTCPASLVRLASSRSRTPAVLLFNASRGLSLSREVALQQQRQQTDDNMITSIHTLIYSDDANATRAFLRDVLGWKYVAEDFDNDWLIFKSGPSEMGVHPTHSEWEGQTYAYPRHHSIALMCDDIEATIGELRAKGAQFRSPIEQLEYGRVIKMIVPGADDIQVYQPAHKLAYNL